MEVLITAWENIREEEEIVSGLQYDNQNFFSEMYDRYAPSLYGLILKWVKQIKTAGYCYIILLLKHGTAENYLMLKPKGSISGCAGWHEFVIQNIWVSGFIKKIVYHFGYLS